MSTEKMREEFEAKYPIPETCEGFNGGFYFVTNIYSGKETRHPHHQKLLIWQASRAAIEVDLPPEDSNIDYPGYISKSETEAAIESLGLKVKP